MEEYHSNCTIIDFSQSSKPALSKSVNSFCSRFFLGLQGLFYYWYRKEIEDKPKRTSDIFYAVFFFHYYEQIKRAKEKEGENESILMKNIK